MQAAELVKRGYDPFTRVERRINAAVTHILNNQSRRSADIVAIGSSRYGFSALSTAAENSDIDGVVAHQPVIWWPSMYQFSDVEYRNPIIQENSLYEEVGQLPPRPVLIQTGYMDDRIGQHNIDKYTQMLSSAYASQGIPDRFQHTTMEIPGHSGYVPPMSFDEIVEWIKKHEFVNTSGK
jgi:hypothetical protein